MRRREGEVKRGAKEVREDWEKLYENGIEGWR
jgi:hypothetical protein